MIGVPMTNPAACSQLTVSPGAVAGEIALSAALYPVLNQSCPEDGQSGEASAGSCVTGSNGNGWLAPLGTVRSSKASRLGRYEARRGRVGGRFEEKGRMVGSFEQPVVCARGQSLPARRPAAGRKRFGEGCLGALPGRLAHPCDRSCSRGMPQ